MNKSVPIIAFATLVLAGCTAPKTTNTPPPTTPDTVKEIVIKDGTFQSDGSYTSPAGPENVGVKLTLSGGVVTDVSVEVKATNPISIKQQTAFAGGIKEVVVGKKLAELTITKVAGSSLTGKGFNDALEKIKAQM